MGKSAGRPPAAPDPTQLANAQGAANTATATAQQRLNMIGTQGPNGSTSYVADPSQPGGYRQVTTLSPGEQQAYDQGNNVYNQALNVAGQQVGRVGDALGQGLNTEGLPGLQGYDPANFDRQKYEDAAYQSATRRLDPQFDRMQESQDARLAAQGLGGNSEATRNARQEFSMNRNDAYSQARNDSYTQGGNEQARAIQQGLAGSTFNNQARTQGLQERAYVQNQPLQQLQALLGTGNVSTPTGVQYSPTQIAGTDVLGANALSLNQQNQNYQARQAQSQAGLQGLFGLGSAGLQAAGSAGSFGALFSDRRLKDGIQRIGELANGLGVYTYNYVWGGPRQVGVMADEVLKVKPHAVVMHPSGFMMVDYGAL